MRKSRKEITLEACRKVLEKYEKPSICHIYLSTEHCSLCHVFRNAPIRLYKEEYRIRKYSNRKCTYCPLSYHILLGSPCMEHYTLKRTRSLDWKKQRARDYKEIIIPILEGLPARRFTPSGYRGFPELHILHSSEYKEKDYKKLVLAALKNTPRLQDAREA